MLVRAQPTRRQFLRACLPLGSAGLPRHASSAGSPRRDRQLPVAAQGRCWYVDNSVSITGDGTTWTRAWKHFSDIGWHSVHPADVIYISGGKYGKIYTETLIVGASGRAGASVTITGAVDDAHAGEVVIDAEGVRANCIVIDGRDHLTIANLTIRNNANDANLVVRHATAGVVIDRVISHAGKGSGNGEDCRCFDIRDCVARPGSIAVVLQNCITSTPVSTTAQTDTLWTSGNDGVLVQNNRFTVANTDPTGHSDCIQSYNDISVTYRCNLLHHPYGGVNNHGFIVSDIQAGGTVYFYDNIVVMGSTPGLAAGRPEAAVFRQVTTTDHTGTVKIWNNTIYGGSSGYHCGSTAGRLPPADEFKNNIVCMLPNSVAAYEFQDGNRVIPANTDYNLFHTYGRGLVVYSCGEAVGAVRSTTAAAASRVYFEVQLAEGTRSSDTVIGIGNAKAALTRPTGTSRESLGWDCTGAIRYAGRRHTAHSVTAGASDVIAFAFDFAARKFWVNNLTRRTGWNAGMPASENPQDGSGGYPVPGGFAGPYFIMISVGLAGDAVILNAGATRFVGARPAGFVPWGSATVLNPADIATPATLNAPVATIAGRGFLHRADWSALGYDRHGVSGDPLFVDPGRLNFQLDAASPARRVGLQLPAVATDYAGHQRTLDAPYSIGAFQG